MTAGHFIFLIAGFVLVIVANEIIHFIERKSLYRYIKADSIKEIDKKTASPRSTPSGHREALNKWQYKEGDK